MACKIIQNINHSCEYNPGGIKDIYLLDIRNFISYAFKDDKLFDQCFVEAIKIAVPGYIHLDTVEESNFNETKSDGIYTQQLSTFVRTLSHAKTSELLSADSCKYLVIYRDFNGRTFTFGSDDGASLTFTQQSGQSGEAAGYTITIDKKSIYPLFEIDIDGTQHITRIFNETFNEIYS